MDPMGSVPEFLKKKMTTGKPMLLDSVRAKLQSVEQSSEPVTYEGKRIFRFLLLLM